MSHKVQQDWCKGLKIAMPRFFKDQAVIEMGSLNVNGSLRPLFDDCVYTGVDVVPGKDVDVVGMFHGIEFKDVQVLPFDVVCSVNSLEHDMYFDKTLPKMYDILRPGGLMFISAGFKWEEHGTLKSAPQASGTTQLGGSWADYYRNVTPEDIMRHFKYEMFQWYMLGICHKDVQFVGIK